MSQKIQIKNGNSQYSKEINKIVINNTSWFPENNIETSSLNITENGVYDTTLLSVTGIGWDTINVSVTSDYKHVFGSGDEDFLITHLYTDEDGHTIAGQTTRSCIGSGFMALTIAQAEYFYKDYHKNDYISGIIPDLSLYSQPDKLAAYQNRDAMIPVNMAYVTTISNYAFYNSIVPYDLKFPVCSYIGDYAFANADATLSIKSQDHIGAIVFSACEEIGKNAFRNRCIDRSGITYLLPSLKIVGERAFHNCYFEGEIKPPSTIQSLGSYAFANVQALDMQYPIHFDNCINFGSHIFYNASLRLPTYSKKISVFMPMASMGTNLNAIATDDSGMDFYVSSALYRQYSHIQNVKVIEVEDD